MTNKPTPHAGPSPAIVWGAVVVVVALLACATSIVLAGKDLGAITNVFIYATGTLLVAFCSVITANLRQVQNQTNGNTGQLQTALIELNKTLTSLVAQSPPLPESTTPNLPEE